MTELLKAKPESNVEPADEALLRLTKDKLYLFGHGTLEEGSARGVLEDGLETRHTDLFSTADGLSTLADDPNAVAENKAAIENWPHLGAKRIIVIGVERLDPENIPHQRYLQSIVQPKPEGKNKA